MTRECLLCVGPETGEWWVKVVEIVVEKDVVAKEAE